MRRLPRDQGRHARGEPWNKQCQACHATATVHNALATKHDASSVTLPNPGSEFGAGGGGTGPGFSDGLESNSFSNWTSADTAGAGGWVTSFSDAFPSNINNWTVTSTNTGSLNWTWNSGGYAEAGPQNTGRSTQTAELTRAVNVSGYTAARVSFDWQYWSLENTNDYFRFEYTTNGSTWTTAYEFIASGTGQSSGSWLSQGPITIPTNTTAIRFQFRNNRENDIVGVDNVLVEGQEPASAGGWTVATAAANTGTYGARAVGTGPQWYYLTKTGIDNSGGTSVSVSYDIAWNTLEAADDVVAQYTTNGSTWVDIKNYAPAGADPATQAYKTETFTGLPAGVTGVRFGLYADNSTGDSLYIDNVTVSPVVAGGGAGSAGASCMNNPNGTECHNVTDVAALHANTTAKCTICHKNNTTAPTANCQTSGCHAGVNLDEHIATGVGTPAHHETGGSFTSFATGGECAGCHDDSIANEHFVLTANTAKPCSVCHATNYTVGTYSPAKATVTARIAAAGITCNGCHTTSTQSAPHVQRMGTHDDLG